MTSRKLSTLIRNDVFRITSIPNTDIRTQLIRFGLGVGCYAKCYQKLPFGPLVIRFRKQEIAIGREIADEILVEQAD